MLKTTSIGCLFLCLAAGLLRSEGAQAQPVARAFETVDVHAAATMNVRPNAFHDLWQPGYGAGLTVSTPFYLGRAEAGAALHRYTPERPGGPAAVPAFDALLVFVGWGPAYRPAPWLTAYAGFRVGTYRMSFDDGNAFQGVSNETEMTLGAHARLDVFLYRGLGLHVAGSYLQAYTFVRLKLFYASAGLSYRMRTPRWLRTFLQ